jgi:hypothetical protein
LRSGYDATSDANSGRRSALAGSSPLMARISAAEAELPHEVRWDERIAGHREIALARLANEAAVA